MSKLDDWIAGWQTLLASDLWYSDADLRARKIWELGQVRVHLGDYYSRALSLLSVSLELPVERLLVATTLTDIADVHAALTPCVKQVPDDALFPRTGWLYDYMHYSTGNEVPLAWHFWCGMSVLAAALKRNVFLDAGAFKVWPNLYLVIVEESASKKSTAIGLASGLLKDMNRLLASRYPELPHLQVPIAADSGTPQKFVDTVQSKQVLMEDPFGEPQLRLADTCAYLAADDLVTLFSKNTFAADRWIEILTHLWDYRGDWKDETLSRQALLRNPALTFVGGTTTEWIRNNVTEAMVGGGWMSRCIYVVHPGAVEKLYARAQRVDPVEAIELASRLIPLTTMPQRMYQPSDDYWAWYENWYNNYVPAIDSYSIDTKMLAYYKRRPTMLHKIAMLLAMSEADFVGTPAHLELADAIMLREERLMPLVFTGINAHIEAQKSDQIYRYMLKLGKPIRHSDLLRNIYPIVGTAEVFKKQMQLLMEMGKVEQFRSGKALAYKLKMDELWEPGDEGASAKENAQPPVSD